MKEETPKNKLSDMLITKVLMGTLGCVPAYDRYFITGLKNQKVSTGLYNMRSILKLVDFYEVVAVMKMKLKKPMLVVTDIDKSEFVRRVRM